MKKTFFALLTALLLLLSLSVCAEEGSSALREFDGKRIGVQTGSISGEVASEVLSDIKLSYFNTQTDILAALRAHKIDAWCTDEPILRFVSIENGDLQLSPEMLDTSSLAALFPKTKEGQALRDQYSAFVDQLWADGTMREIDAKWFGTDESKRTVLDYEALPDTNGTLRMALDTSILPFAFVKDGRVVGYDVDIAARFCQANGYGLKISPMDFNGVLPTLQSGKADFAACGITVTEERAESMLFSSPNYHSGTALAVLKSSANEAAQASAGPKWREYNGKRIGVLTGPLMEDIAHENFPDSEYMLFNSYPDCITALLAGRIDAYLGDEPGLKSVHAEQPKIDYIHERITNQDYSFAFRKNDPESAALCEELNAFLALSHENGTMQELDDIWFGVDEERKNVDMSDLTGEKGTIRVVTTSTDMPWSYIKDGKNVGYDIDLVVRFCRHAGYKLELGDVDFAARIPAIQSGKYDFTTDMNVTEERKEQVLFSDPTSSGGVVLAILTDGSQAGGLPDQLETVGQGSKEKQPITSLSMLAQPGVNIAVGLDTPAGKALARDYPNAKLVPYTDIVLAYMDVANGRMDACMHARTEMEFAIQNGFTGVRLLDENYISAKIVVGISPVSTIPDLKGKLNAFIAELKADGTLDDMYDRWVIRSEDTMPDNIPRAENPAFKLRVGTTGTVMPYSYFVGTELAGYDIELANRFAGWLGAELELKVYDFGGIVPAAETGSIDCIMSNLFYTEEKSQAIPFSDVLFEVQITAMVRSDGQGQNSASTAEYTSLSQLNGKRIGVMTGTISGRLAENRLPNAQVNYFNTQADSLAALKMGKIDAWCTDEPIVRFMKIENPELMILDEYLAESNLAAVFPKTEAGQALCSQYNDFLKALWADGTMAEIDEAWFGADDAKRTVMDYESLPAANGTLRMAADLTQPPFTYMKDNRAVGYDIDVAARFCQEYGYGLVIEAMSFDGVLAAVQSGKCDFASSCITITQERAESMLFSNPNYYGGIVMAVLKKDQPIAAQPGVFTSLSQLNGKRIGVQTGTTFDEIVLETLPNAQISYFNSYPDMAAALESNKIDGFPGDEPVLQLMAAENPKLGILSERMDSFEFGFVLPKTEAGEALQAELDAWIASIQESGELAKTIRKWTEGTEDDKTVPDYGAFPATKGTLKLATEGAYAPMNYYRENEVVGMEIDMAAQFCEANGYGLTVEAMNFDGILSAVQAGKADFAAAGISITEERKESVNFSAPYYTGGTVMAVLKAETAPVSVADGVYKTLDELNGRNIGVQTGQSFDAMVSARLPEATLTYYNNKADLINALTTGKIVSFAADEPVAKVQMQENDKLTYVPEYLDSFEFGYVFAKTEEGAKLRDQMNEYLKTIQADGTLAEIDRRWFGLNEADKTLPDYKSFPAPNGTLRLATEALYEPFSYIKNNEIVGYDIDIIVRFCEAYGYGLEIEDMNFAGILPAVQSGKSDMGCAGITITAERAESVYFSDPNYSGGTVMMVLKAEAPAAASTAVSSQTESFWDGLAASFNKTFIREARWKLFLEGVGTTMLITLLSILFGTALGFVVFMLCRNGNLVANGATRFSIWLVTGTPMVVLLMILYYIIFGSVAISGIAVAVIGFTLTFGAAVFSLLKMGVGTIDRGQYEAAYALGHSNRHTFFKIILPQAIPHVLPAYQGEIVGLIKATAIVGYIAVQDLTKMGDIVRSRTYEAFFPLIAVTVIYFVLEGLFSLAVSRIRISIDPKKRKRDRILKGVNIHD